MKVIAFAHTSGRTTPVSAILPNGVKIEGDLTKEGWLDLYKSEKDRQPAPDKIRERYSEFSEHFFAERGEDFMPMGIYDIGSLPDKFYDSDSTQEISEDAANMVLSSVLSLWFANPATVSETLLVVNQENIFDADGNLTPEAKAALASK